jgi:formate dehydrogenase subunit gamma
MKPTSFSYSWVAGIIPLGIVSMLPMLLMVFLLPASAIADEDKALTPIQVPNPAANLWREVRQREGVVTGITQVRGVDSAALINPYGNRWRQFRMEQLLPYGGYALVGMVVLLGIFYLTRGRIPIEAGTSDKRLFRYTVYERTIHWFIVSLFLFMAFTGLILLFGRPLLIPITGSELFSLLASASKEGHNLFGPVFLLALLLMFFRFVRRNIYERGDLTWLLKGGGIVGKTHLPSNFFNMGEKTFFWMLILIGAVIVASGLLLVFPVFGQGRAIMELSHVAHGIGALVMITAVLGHIYIGTIGMEGAIDNMKSGYCDLNWAMEHHSNWAERCEQHGDVLTAEQAAKSQGMHQSDSVETETVQETR